MLLLICSSSQAALSLSDYSDISQVIIAAISLTLAGYIFVYQKGRDASIESNTARLNEQNIRLQWFRDLIIQPNYLHLTTFFENLESVKNMITSDNMADVEIIAINRFIKDEASNFRMKFYDILLKIDNRSYRAIKTEVEALITTLTTVFSDDEHKLTNPKTFDREVLEPIKYAKNNIVAIIFSYKGE